MKLRRVLAVLAVAALLVAACGGDPPSSDGGDDAGGGGDDRSGLPECPLDALEEAAADGPVEINLWYAALVGTTGGVMRDMVTRFNESQDEIVLQADDQGPSYPALFREYESAASASTDQLPDIIYLEDTNFGAMVDRGQVLPAQACMEADGYDLTDIDPVARSTYSVGDVLYPGYMNVSTPILYYNKAHWARAGLDPDDPPDTLDELYEQAVALKEAGVSERPLSINLNSWFFTTWMSGAGVDVVNNRNGREDPATEASIDTPEARELLELLQQMNDEGLLNVFAFTEGNIDHYLALATQQSSMLVETSTASTTIRDALAGTLTPEEAGVDVDPSVFDRNELVPATGQLPGLDAPGQVYAGGGAFYILNTSDPAQQAASWKFLQFMLQPENALEWHVNGSYLPVVKAVQDEPAVQDYWEQDVAGVLLQNAVEQLDDADPDRPGPLIGPYPDYDTAVQGALEDILLNGADIESSLASAQDDLTASLERYEGG